MDFLELTFFTQRRNSTSSAVSPIHRFTAEKYLSADYAHSNFEKTFGSQLSAFQSMEANDDEVLDIINSVGPPVRDLQIVSFQPENVSRPNKICKRCEKKCDNDLILFENIPYHKDHFTCLQCKKKFDEGRKPILEKGDVICSQCFEQKQLKSTQTITKQNKENDSSCSINNENSSGQTTDAVCEVCKKPLSNEDLKQIDGHFYCCDHAPKYISFACAQCKTEITGKCISALGQHFHSKCFVCQYCKENLTNKQYVEWNDLPVCKNCFKKLPKNVRIEISKKSIENNFKF